MACPLLLNLLCAACLIGYFQTTSSIAFTLTDKNAKYTPPNVPCPADKPFILRNGTHYVCVSSCGPEMVVDGSTCIKVTECTKPVLSGGRCMEQCPVGYLYINFVYKDCFEGCSYNSNDIGANPCVTKIYLVACEVCYVSGIILYSVFIWIFFSTRQLPLIKLVTWVTCMKRKKIKAPERERLINADDTDD